MTDPTPEAIGQLWLTETIAVWRRNKALADGALEQLDEAQLRRSLDPEANSIAVVMKHVAGNLRSRWTDFLSSDGEKPGRRRDDEFVDDYPDRDAMLADWEDGWRVLFAALDELRPADLTREVEIRGVRLTVPHALLRSITHCAYHIGQVVQSARIVAGADWRTLTVPRGGSERFNRERWGRG